MSTFTHFFIFSLGPVQSFIAQARKAQDLYLGCRLISDYCRHAALSFQEQGGTIIFPTIQSPSITNRFMGTIELPDQDQQEALGNRVAAAVQSRFVEEGMTVIQAALGKGATAKDIMGLREQLASHLQTYWVFSPYDATNYTESYRKAERIFGMSKHLRTPKPLAYQGTSGTYEGFDQGFLGETGRKCTVDGEMNVKVYRWSDSDHERHQNAHSLLERKLFLGDRKEVILVGAPEVQDEGSFVSINDIPPKFIQDGEGLSAVSFFKRCYKPDFEDTDAIDPGEWAQIVQRPQHWKAKYQSLPYFQEIELPSAAKIALLDTLREMKSDEESPLLTSVRTSFRALDELIHQARPEYFRKKYPNYRTEDEELYFEENHTESYFRKHHFEPVVLPQLKRAHRKFQTSLPQTDGYKVALSPYYALVAIDIDGLGKHLQRLSSEKAHRETAEQLHQFAKEVTNQVSGQGRVLHAGGDDFLLMLNLHGLFGLLGTIQAFWEELNQQLTYSTSLIIAHYKSPLTRAVSTAKAELSAVKKRFEQQGKAGMSCSFMAKSGAVSTTYFKQDKLSILDGLFQALHAGAYSPQFIFQFALNMESLGLGGETSAEEQEQLRAYALRELKRLLGRARDSKQVTSETAQALGDTLRPLLEEQIRDNQTQFDLPNFLQFLKMAELAAKHTNQWP